MEEVRITPYYYDPQLLMGRAPRLLWPVIRMVSTAFFTPIQFLFPLTAFGLILDGVLGKHLASEPMHEGAAL